MAKPKVLFLCTGNSCRSQMAEGLLRHLAGDRFEVVSAGTEPTSVNPLAVDTMREIGIDISGQRSKSVRQFLGDYFTYVITVCSSANERCPIFPGTVHRLHWPVEDPARAVESDAERLPVFRRARDDLAQRIRDFIAE
ncbi:MAG TPA: arsenate reductase ArsC [Candidatus Binatia bacterium]|nr:arsenate reductase ArsC [Candidatus Binatia bacterium]